MATRRLQRRVMPHLEIQMTTLCEECFGGWADAEVLTHVPLGPCIRCGRYDKREKGGLRCHMFRTDPRFHGVVRPTREQVIALARAAGINGEPAGPDDDGIDTWYGNQYLECGSLSALVELAMREGRAQALEIAQGIHAEAAEVAHPDADGWTAECVRRIREA